MNRAIVIACWALVAALAGAAGVSLAIAAGAESTLLSAFAAVPPLATPSWVDRVTRATAARSAAGGATVAFAVAALISTVAVVAGSAVVRMRGALPRRTATAGVAVLGAALLLASIAMTDRRPSGSTESIDLDPSTQTVLVDVHVVTGTARNGSPVLVTFAHGVDGGTAWTISSRTDFESAFGSSMTVDPASGALAGGTSSATLSASPTKVPAPTGRIISEGESATDEFGALTPSTVSGWAGVLLLAVAAALTAVRMRRGPLALLVAAAVLGVATVVCAEHAADPMRRLLTSTSFEPTTLVPDPFFVALTPLVALAAAAFAAAALAAGALRASALRRPSPVDATSAPIRPVDATSAPIRPVDATSAPIEN